MTKVTSQARHKKCVFKRDRKTWRYWELSAGGRFQWTPSSVLTALTSIKNTA